MTGYNKHFLIAMGVFGAYIASSNILSFSLPLLALDISGTGTGLALIKGAGFIPNIVLAVFVGVINDRLRKSTGFRVYSSTLAIAALALFAGLAAGMISITGLMVFMIAFNAVGYALGNMQLTLIRLVVPHEKLADATALTSAVNSTITTVAPAVGGLLLYLLGHTNLVGAIAVILLLASLASMAVQPEETTPTPIPFSAALREGWHAFRTNRDLVMMTVAVVLTNAAEGAFVVAVLIKLTSVLGANEFQIGVIFALSGMGGVIGSLFAARLRRYLGVRLSFYAPMLVLAAVHIAAMLAPNLITLAIVYIADGAVSLFSAISIWSYRQEAVSAAHMGRVAGITGAIFKIGMPPVIFLAGWMTDAGALNAVFWMAAGIMVTAALFLSFVAGWGLPARKPI